MSVATACATITAVPSTRPSPTEALLQTPTASHGEPSPPPTESSPLIASPSPTPPGTPLASTPSALDVEVHEIPSRFTSPLGDVVSLGNEIIWVGSDAFWRYVPSLGEPELLLRANQNDPIVAVAGSDTGYLYQTRERIPGYDPPNHWRLWYLPVPGARPLLIDQYDNDGLPDPSFAIDDNYIVWTSFHGLGDDAVSTLRVVDLDQLDQPRDLVSYPAFDISVWLPELDGGDLWYGVSTNDWDAGTVHPRVEMVDLADPTAAPVVYGEDVRAFMPAVNDRVVAWKGGGTPDLAALNAGELFIYWRDTGVAEPIAIPNGSSDRISHPSVGSRFVCWWDEIDTHFYVYDLDERRVRVIAEYEPTGEERILAPSLTGRLLTFVYTRGERHSRQVRWAILPE